jgi:hypothetical protein
LLKHSILEELSLFIIDKQRVRLVCKSINFSLLPKILSGRQDSVGGGGGASVASAARKFTTARSLPHFAKCRCPRRLPCASPPGPSMTHSIVK